MPPSNDPHPSTPVALLQQVPDLTLSVAGSSFGGQYWHEQEYEVIFAVADDRQSVAVTAHDTSGAPRGDDRLTATGLASLVTQVQASPPVHDDSPIEGLGRVLVWDLLADESDHLRLESDLVEVAEWATYVLGTQRWDPAEKEWLY